MEDEASMPPASSVVLAFSAMVPIAAAALTARWLPRAPGDVVARLGLSWAASTLCFLSGVRRGLSFRQPDGAPIQSIASMLVFFCCGSGAALIQGRRNAAIMLLLLGYGAEAVIDPIAARAGRAPRYFAPLRPVQLLIPLASLAVLTQRERRRSQ